MKKIIQETNQNMFEPFMFGVQFFLFNDLTFLCLTKNQYAACKSNLLKDSNFIQGVNQLTIDKKNPWFICK